MNRTAFRLLLILFTAILSPLNSSGAETLSVKGVSIHYMVEGQGEPVLLIHGLYSSARGNWGTAGTIRLLAKNFQVIAPDMPGFGESDKPETESAYGLQDVDDLVQLLDHLHVRKAHIVGYSMGGIIAGKFISLHPDRVLSVVFGGMGVLEQGSVLQAGWEHMGSHSRKTPEAAVQGVAKLALSQAEIKAINSPLLILVGDWDPVKRKYIEPVRRLRPDWRIIEIARAGHLICPFKEQFKNELERWLLEHRQVVLDRGAGQMPLFSSP